MYVIYSQKTDSPYIDEKRTAILFEDEERSEKFIEETPRVYAQETEDTLKHILSECYAAGAVMAEFVEKDGSVRRERIDEDSLERRFYNGGANGCVALYLHTKDPKYLGKIKKNKFIVPISITNHPEVSILYSIASKNEASKNEDAFFFVVFTDLDEYYRWESANGGKRTWMPLMVDFETMKKLGRKHGFILNPSGMKFVMSLDILKKIKEAN